MNQYYIYILLGINFNLIIHVFQSERQFIPPFPTILLL